MKRASLARSPSSSASGSEAEDDAPFEPQLELVNVADDGNAAMAAAASADEDADGVSLFSSAVQTAPQPLADAPSKSGAPRKPWARAGQSEGVPSELAHSFADLRLSPWLLQSLASLRIECPTSVQVACVPAALAGKDIIGCAEARGCARFLAVFVPDARCAADGFRQDAGVCKFCADSERDSPLTRCAA